MVIRFLRGAADRLAEVNPLPAYGQPVFDVTNNILKVGDGVRRYLELPQIGSEVPSEEIEAAVEAYLEANPIGAPEPSLKEIFENGIA